MTKRFPCRDCLVHTSSPFVNPASTTRSKTSRVHDSFIGHALRQASPRANSTNFRASARSANSPQSTVQHAAVWLEKGEWETGELQFPISPNRLPANWLTTALHTLPRLVSSVHAFESPTRGKLHRCTSFSRSSHSRTTSSAPAPFVRLLPTFVQTCMEAIYFGPSPRQQSGQ